MTMPGGFSSFQDHFTAVLNCCLLSGFLPSLPLTVLPAVSSLSSPQLITINTMPPHLPWWFSGKEFACNAGDLCSILGSGRCPGEGNGYPHSSILAWRSPWAVIVHGSQRVGHDWATFTLLTSLAGSPVLLRRLPLVCTWLQVPLLPPTKTYLWKVFTFSPLILLLAWMSHPGWDLSKYMGVLL